jgi:hypothetical protein
VSTVGRRANRDEQIELDDPSQEWKIVNAWFVKQYNFDTRFKLREIVKPREGVAATVAEH